MYLAAAFLVSACGSDKDPMRPVDGKFRATVEGEGVPAGSVITVESTALNGDKLIGVLWAEKDVMMFTQDLRARGEKLD